MMPTVSEELTESSHALTTALYKGSLSAVSASLPPLAEALAPAAAEHWGLVKTLGRNIGHTMEELTDMGFALDALDKLVSSKSKEIRAAACWALAEIGAERPDNISGLAYRLAKDEAWEVRDQIAAAYDERIGPAQPRSLFELMRRWSNDSDERVRRAPALSLIRRARRDRVPVLAILEVLRRDASIYVRKGVVYCLQQAWGRAENPNYGPLTPDSPSFLLRLLRDWAKDPSPNTRWVVAYTLAHTWVAPYLADALSILRMIARDPNELVQKAATAALLGLRKLENPLLRRTLEAWAAENYEPTVSLLARRVLAEMPVSEETAAPPAPAASNVNRNRDGRAHNEGRATNDSRATNDGRGPNHRQRRHQQGRQPAPNGNPPAPIRIEQPPSPVVPTASVAPLIEATAPAPVPTPRQRNRQSETTPQVEVATPVATSPAPEATATPKERARKAKSDAAPDAALEARAASVEQSTLAPKKRASKAKPEAAPDTMPEAQSASVEQPTPAPKKRTSKAKSESSTEEITPAPKKPRANSKLKTQNSKLEAEEAANG